MKIKKGVIMQGLSPKMRTVLIEANKLYKKYNANLVVTSALDGEHSAGSAHYYGFGLDFRTWNVGKRKARLIVSQLKRILGAEFYVLLEKDHIHVNLIYRYWGE